jgi:hypothetical protein
MINEMILSVVLIFNPPGGGQQIGQYTFKFTGPTAIQYCQNAKLRLNSMNARDNIIVINASCISN